MTQILNHEIVILGSANPLWVFIAIYFACTAFSLQFRWVVDVEAEVERMPTIRESFWIAAGEWQAIVFFFAVFLALVFGLDYLL